jgi:hypothetical protein
VSAIDGPEPRAPAMLSQAPRAGNPQSVSPPHQPAALEADARWDGPSRASALSPGERRGSTNAGRTRPAEARIFVPPRAPDDPGTGAAEDEALLMPDLRGSTAKA